MMSQGEATVPILIGRSTTTEPTGARMWPLLVTDELAESCQEWSQPVAFRFKRLKDGRVEMWMRGMP